MNSEKVGLDLTKVLIWLDISSYSHIFCETKKPIVKTVVRFNQELNSIAHVCYGVKTLWCLCVCHQRAQYCLLLSQSIHIFSCAYSCSASQYGIILSTSRCLYQGASCTASDSCILSFDRTIKLIMQMLVDHMWDLPKTGFSDWQKSWVLRPIK